MNILILIHSMSAGGAERVTANMANYWAEKGWEVTVATIASAAGDFYALHPAVRRIALDLAADSPSPLAALSNNWRRIAAIRTMLNTIRPDVAIGMMTAASVYLSIASRCGRRCKVIGSEHVHPSHMPLGRLWTGLRAYWYGKLSAVTALTSESAQWLKENTRTTRVAVIPNAVPWPVPAQAPRLAAPAPSADGQKMVLAVGRLSHEKGFDILIAVFAQLAARHPTWRLVILGEGPLRPALESQVRQAGLASRIELPGLAGNVADWYDGADLYVMSSRYEGFGNTLVEAMSHGVAVVSFDCDSGPRNIISDGTDGLLVAPGDTAALERALDRMMGDEVLRARLRAQGIGTRERFSLGKVMGMWETLFSELV